MSIEDFRERFLKEYCHDCIQPINSQQCGSTFSQVLQPILLPVHLQDTHELCEHCLDLYPRRYHNYHVDTCLFYRNDLHLTAGGWTTPSSRAILRTLRKSRRFSVPVANLLQQILSKFYLTIPIIVPIPMGNSNSSPAWFDLVREVTTRFPGSQFGNLLIRNKVESTRSSVAQKRQRIVKAEYQCGQEAPLLLKGAIVVVVDDNVTTGATMIGCINLLRQHEPLTIVPVALEKNLHPRLLNNIQKPTQIVCAAFTPKTSNP